MVGELPNLLAFLVAVLGRHLLPLLIRLLLGLVTTLLLVLCLGVALLGLLSTFFELVTQLRSEAVL